MLTFEQYIFEASHKLYNIMHFFYMLYSLIARLLISPVQSAELAAVPIV